MPKPKIPDGLYVSVSQVRAFLKCPAFFAFKYVLREPPAFVPVNLAFGTAIHTALAAFYVERMTSGEPLHRDLLVDVFRSAWAEAAEGPVPLQPDEEDEAGLDQLTDKGVSMLHAFYEGAAGSLEGGIVEAVEHSFAVGITDPATGEPLDEQLIGTFDLVVRDSAGRRTIIEHKTAAKKWAPDALQYDLQPTAYKLAARTSGLGDVALRLQVITKTRVPSVQIADVERSPRDEKDFLTTVVGVLRAVQAGVDYPLPGWPCRSCPYAYCCR